MSLLQGRKSGGGDGGDWTPPNKSGAKRFFLEITIDFLERKKSLVTGLESNHVSLLLQQTSATKSWRQVQVDIC